MVTDGKRGVRMGVVRSTNETTMYFSTVSVSSAIHGNLAGDALVESWVGDGWFTSVVAASHCRWNWSIQA